jgi:hypothetical protein
MIRQADSGTTKTNLLLGDIDCDGRIDYCTQDPTGSFGYWRTGDYEDESIKKRADYWQGISQGGGATVDRKGVPNNTGVQIIVSNGDFGGRHLTDMSIIVR